MKLRAVTTLVSLLGCGQSAADCHGRPGNQDYIEEVRVVSGVNTGGNHGDFHGVTVRAPTEVNGVPLDGFVLWYGDLQSAWAPLDYELVDGAAEVYLEGTRGALAQFMITVYHSGEGCDLFDQAALYRHLPARDGASD